MNLKHLKDSEIPEDYPLDPRDFSVESLTKVVNALDRKLFSKVAIYKNATFHAYELYLQFLTHDYDDTVKLRSKLKKLGLTNDDFFITFDMSGRQELFRAGKIKEL